jgi:hypothetical protein
MTCGLLAERHTAGKCALVSTDGREGFRQATYDRCTRPFQVGSGANVKGIQMYGLRTVVWPSPSEETHGVAWRRTTQEPVKSRPRRRTCLRPAHVESR